MVHKIVEENTETAIEMTVMTEAGTGLEKDHFPEIMATMLEIEVQATVGPGQDQEQVKIGIEFNVISEGNMIISQGTVQLLGKKRDIMAPTNAKFGRLANLSNTLKHARQFQ